jgi:hypothetical protein
MFNNFEVWCNVGDRDRRELYDDVVHQLAKKEKVIMKKSLSLCVNVDL